MPNSCALISCKQNKLELLSRGIVCMGAFALQEGWGLLDQDGDSKRDKERTCSDVYV
jgi:hypothetical protein